MSTCAISGLVPEEPVVSSTGYLFEKRLITKHIEATGVCPITNQPLSMSDLITIKTASTISKPRAPTMTSFPALLNSLQSEWDNIMLESFNLKQQVDTLKRELAVALYQQDASKRVIARLIIERDEARAALSDVEKNVDTFVAKSRTQLSSTATPMSDTVESTEQDSVKATTTEPKKSNILPENIIAIINDTYTKLFTQRKETKKQRTSEATSANNIKEFILQDTLSPEPFLPASSGGISCSTKINDFYIFGSKSGQIIMTHPTSKSIQYTSPSHTSSILSVYAFHDVDSNIIILAYSQNQVTIYQATPSFNRVNIIQDLQFQDTIIACSLHPSSVIFALAKQNSWSLYNTLTGQELTSLESPTNITSLQFNADSQFILVGYTNSTIEIFDIRTTLAPVQCCVCDENSHIILVTESGFHLVIATDNGAYLYDLRKMNKVAFFKTSGPVRSIFCDNSGSYVGITGEFGVYVLETKKFQVVHHISTTDIQTEVVLTGVFTSKAKAILVGTTTDSTYKVLSNTPDCLKEEVE